jgi:purine-binding chemotaxis protein CheW
MALRQVCTFTLDNLLFGVDVARVQEVNRHHGQTPVPLAPRVVGGLINLRGQIVTAIDLRRRLELPERPREMAPMSVVVRGEDDIHSLLVDEVGEVLNVEESAFEAPPPTLDTAARGLITGAYKLADRLLLELDVARATCLEEDGAARREGLR